MEKNAISRELSQEEVQEAIKEKHCPFCKDECKSFWATVSATQGFSLNDKGEIEWGDVEGWNNVSNVECRECGEDIPKEIWLVWLKREQV